MLNSCDLVIFGATGDLAIRKLLPALYRAFEEQSLAEDVRIFLTCRTDKQVENYIQKVEDTLPKFLNQDEFKAPTWSQFKLRLRPVLIDIQESEIGWLDLKDQLDESKDRIFYMSVAPSLYGVCCENLSKNNLINDSSRVVLEKPIGYDKNSANGVNTQVGRFFKESQIFRIDHYLGKETVQNLLILRFTNLLFENMWDRQSIDHIQISISETVGLEGRAGFYDDAGAMRDMVQNHLLQLLCLVAMEPPNQLNGDSIRTEKIKVLEALKPITKDNIRSHTVRGQYVTGEANGELVPGYLEELGNPKSFCETFVAIKAEIENWRWAGTPIYLRTGKRLKSRYAEIIVQFKPVSHSIYSAFGSQSPNRLAIRLQPDETIQLILTSKKLNSTQMELREAALDLNLNDKSHRIHSDAYKRLLIDVIANDPSLFIHREEIDHAWAWVDPIIEGWKEIDYQPELYRAGSWGPDASEELLKKDGRQWFNGVC